MKFAIPYGYALVPIIPNDDMLVAFAEAWYSRQQCIDDPQMGEAYAAMLSIAPAPNAETEEWKYVPIEPTEEMIAAGDVHMDGISQLGDAWANMLASVPELK